MFSEFESQCPNKEEMITVQDILDNLEVAIEELVPKECYLCRLSENDVCFSCMERARVQGELTAALRELEKDDGERSR